MNIDVLISVATEPLNWGTIHLKLLTILSLIPTCPVLFFIYYFIITYYYSLLVYVYNIKSLKNLTCRKLYSIIA